jgi:hypothetical protein
MRMPLPEPAERQAIHRRTIECRGFRRADGLWDIEGRMIDTKEYAFDSSWRGRLEPGTAVHDMVMRLTLDESLTIRDIGVASDAHPFPNCAEIEPAYRTLIGTSLAPGWTKLVKDRLGGVAGCTHLTRLAQELAVVALQTIMPLRHRDEAVTEDASRKPPHLDGCHALATDGPIVREIAPRWYRGKP